MRISRTGRISQETCGRTPEVFEKKSGRTAGRIPRRNFPKEFPEGISRRFFTTSR